MKELFTVGAIAFCLVGCTAKAIGNDRSAIVGNPNGMINFVDALKVADQHCNAYGRSARLNYKDDSAYYFDCL